jgi:hypothetical protein
MNEVQVFAPLPSQTENAAKANLLAVISARNLTEDTADTAQTLTLFKAKAGQSVRLVRWLLKKAAKDPADAAFNSTTVAIGNAGATTRLLAATQANANGSFVKQIGGPVAGETVAAVATADASDLATAQALANALKTAHNALVGLLNNGTAYVYAADTDVIATIGSMAAKKLKDIKEFELHLYFDVQG